jgi:tRNA(Arg) A34 adenosine deaminase TadA
MRPCLAGEVLGARANQHDALDHAEIAALKSAHEAGWDPRGATAYLTLEPCSNQGRTRSGADALIAAGIARCVVATINPNPAWPPLRAQLCALLMSWYNTSLREGNTSEKFASRRSGVSCSHRVTSRRPIQSAIL